VSEVAANEGIRVDTGAQPDVVVLVVLVVQVMLVLVIVMAMASVLALVHTCAGCNRSSVTW
jgi:hypothetical protein